MNSRQFVESIDEVVRKGTVRSSIQLLKHPSGRKPDPSLKMLSEWFLALSKDNQDKVQSIVDMTARHAAYSVLAILDGIAAIEPVGPKGNLELYYDDGTKRTLLNDKHLEELTVLFKENSEQTS